MGFSFLLHTATIGVAIRFRLVIVIGTAHWGRVYTVTAPLDLLLVLGVDDLGDAADGEGHAGPGGGLLLQLRVDAPLLVEDLVVLEIVEPDRRAEPRLGGLDQVVLVLGQQARLLGLGRLLRMRHLHGQTVRAVVAGVFPLLLLDKDIEFLRVLRNLSRSFPLGLLSSAAEDDDHN